METLLVRTSKVSRFKSGSRSVKTTIPLEVAELLSIKPGDTITWEVKVISGKRVAVIRQGAR